MIRTVALASLFFAGACVSQAFELLTNGDFEQGASIGFSSDYIYNNTTDHSEGTWSVTTDPLLRHSSWGSFPDHTTNPGENMLVANGSVTAGKKVWKATVTAAPNTSFTFSGWAASTFSSSPANLSFVANGSGLGTLQLTGTVGIWQGWSLVGNSGATGIVDLSIIDLVTLPGGNDFALDDLSFDGTPVPEPLSITALTVGLIAVLRRRRKSA